MELQQTREHEHRYRDDELAKTIRHGQGFCTTKRLMTASMMSLQKQGQGFCTSKQMSTFFLKIKHNFIKVNTQLIQSE